LFVKLTSNFGVKKSTIYKSTIPTAHQHLIISKLKLVQSTECTVSRLASIIVTKGMHN